MHNGTSIGSQDGQLGGATTPHRTMQGSAATEEVQRMQLREERLQATKESVQTGEIGLHKEVVTEQQSIDVLHEEVYIKRRFGSGRVFHQPGGQDGESIRVPMSAEQVNVTKQTLDTGKVTIGKGQVRDCLAGTGDQTG